MTAAAVRSRRGGFGSARSPAGREVSSGHRAPRVGMVQFVMATVFLMVTLAVTLQAQRVTGQDAIEGLLAETAEADRQGAELRARVAAAESPAEVLAAAESMGMVQPAAVVAVPAAGGNTPAPGTDGGSVG